MTGEASRNTKTFDNSTIVMLESLPDKIKGLTRIAALAGADDANAEQAEHDTELEVRCHWLAKHRVAEHSREERRQEGERNGFGQRKTSDRREE